MTSERAQAYGRVTRTLDEMGPSKLQPGERDTLREAADTLLFCEDVTAEPAATEAIASVDALVDNLVESERWTPERAGALREDVLACGPTVNAG